MVSKVVPFEKPLSVQDRAAQWLVELDYRDPSQVDTAELEVWLAESAEHRRVFRETALVYGQADVLQVLADLLPLELEPAALSDAKSRPAFSPSSWPRRGGSIAAAVVLSCALGFGLVKNDGWFDRQGQPRSYATEVGGRKLVELDDGSTLTLNTDTALQIELTDTLRKVVLERGEAFFSVASDPERPFVVVTGEGLVTAVGTAFSVYKRELGVEVTVTEGRVRVQAVQKLPPKQSGPGKPHSISGMATGTLDQRDQDKGPTETVLDSGQVATFSKTIEHVETVAREKLSRKLIWQQGMLAFEGESLEEVIDQFSRYTTLKISIEGSELRSIAVDGYFKSDDLASMLNSLRLNFGIEVVREDDDRIVLKRS
ncbi:FecR family protein [Kineobactrum salinum]|uniref:DUF4880 domain-containing protein n=1 Tax=Kineobactrum salinum TaxID=2708301 RepID=A0A6C0U4S0_9GAMM|nr:FecR domain-containing protein [Kineobactrum salinum]QIB66996.1 DUF4880 domain-containing protein [Kineobactrum salinum]